ncbi:hypothetical protein AVEN_240905-1 [Araneus ventricosus]|uniref:Uncharacterized protein n=1 Tax=Araneus ventricosus TaxID=182803 RepID=A0A4Y2V879_ARAVE|nr:hypothetical protein AVEN_240905-1 [Araneus ventricosus]
MQNLRRSFYDDIIVQLNTKKNLLDLFPESKYYYLLPSLNFEGGEHLYRDKIEVQRRPSKVQFLDCGICQRTLCLDRRFDERDKDHYCKRKHRTTFIRSLIDGIFFLVQ